MRKSFVLVALVAACLSTSAKVRDTRTQTTGFQKAGIEHTILRPLQVTMPKGYTQTLNQNRVKTEQTPDEQLEASTWSVLEHENGSDWFFTQTYEEQDSWWYASSDITVYNDKLEKQATIHFTAPEGEHCNSIQPFGKITTKFFDIKEATWEMMIYVHCTTADYTGKNYIFIVNNNGDIVAQYDGYAASWQEMGTSYNKETRLLLGREDKTTNQMIVDVYKKAGWSTGPTVMHTFTVDEDLTNYSSGSAVNAFSINDEAYYTVNHYEQSYADGMDDNYMPTVRANNNYVVEVYDKNFNLYKTIKSPVETSEKGYCMQTFGFYSDADLNRDFNTDGSNNLDLIISHENYFTDTTDDSYIYGWTIYNENNEKINEFGGRAIDWWELNSIKGQPTQVAFYTIDEDENGHIELYDMPSCDFITAFDDTVEGLPITTNFNRAAVGDSYDYVTSISQGFYDEEKNILGVVAWFTPEGKLDKRINFNMGPDAQYFSCALGDMMLNPYLFDTDEGMEYLYSKKVLRAGTTNTLDNILVVADSDGTTIRSFAPDATFTSLGNCDILLDTDGNSHLMVTFSSDDSNYEISRYTLPFSKWPGGGDGSEANPYVITSVGDLQMIKDNLSAHYVLGNDLDFYQLGEGWSPIQHFTGTLDGKNHKLKNFYINSDDYASGLFGYVEGAKVKNIIFDRPEIVPSEHCNYVGVVAAYSSGYAEFSNITITNPHVQSDTYKGYCGLISALAGSYTTASECYIAGADVEIPNASNVGGIFGDARASGIAKACYIQGQFTAKSALGGVLGNTLADSYAINCHVNADLTADHNVGAIVGENNQRATIEKNFAEGTVKATTTEEGAKLGAGGIVGYTEPNWGGKGNAIAARYNVSAVVVDGAGEKTSAHRIAGYTVNDYDWTEEDLAKRENFTEAGLTNNVSTAPEADGMTISATSTDGLSMNENDITESYLTNSLSWSFGNSVDAPWTYSKGKLHLFFESSFTGIEDVNFDGEDSTISGSKKAGIFDLQGRQHDSITAPGLYIVNGKKVVIK